MTKKIKIYTVVMLALYIVALLTCFICDLALNGALTWFYIVLVSIIISFSITNLPFIVPKCKIIVSVLMVTLFTYVLLFVCCKYVNGDWLLSFAYPIATYSFIFAWIFLFISKTKKMNWGFKTSIILLLSSVFVITCNPLVLILSGDKFKFIDLFIYDGGAVNYSANGIVFLGLIASSIISAFIGCILLKRIHS